MVSKTLAKLVMNVEMHISAEFHLLFWCIKICAKGHSQLLEWVVILVLTTRTIIYVHTQHVVVVVVVEERIWSQ
jgi:hypothetical protein